MTEDTTEPTVIKQEYHRNGVGGEGFVASLVTWPLIDKEYSDGFMRNPFLAISFFGEGGEKLDKEKTAVLSIPMLLEGEIGFGRNSWRGADYIGPAVAKAWEDRGN